MIEALHFLRKAIIDRLSGSIVLNSQNVPVYNRVPSNATEPFIKVYSLQNEEIEFNRDTYILDCITRIDVVTSFDGDSGGELDANQIVSQVLTLVRTRANDNVTNQINDLINSIRARSTYNENIQETENILRECSTITTNGYFDLSANGLNVYTSVLMNTTYFEEDADDKTYFRAIIELSNKIAQQNLTTTAIPENPYTPTTQSSSQGQQSVTLNYRFIFGVDSSISTTEYYYYPLFATQAEANYYDSQNGGTGTSHTHTFVDDPSSTTWYMPTNGGTHSATSPPSGSEYTEITSYAYVDTDGDGILNAVDTDDDGDGQTDANETLYGSDPLDSTSTYADLDGDGIADSSDNDRDGDGYENSVDAFPDDASQWQAPSSSFAGAILEFTTTSANQQVKIGTRTYNAVGFNNSPNYTVDWGDGNSDTITSLTRPTHTYSSAGTYDVKISGTFTRFQFGVGLSGAERLFLTDIKQWGNLTYETMEDAFKSCDGLNVLTATDTPTIGTNGKLKNAFSYSDVVTIPNLGSWDVAHISDFTNAFLDAAKPLDTTTYDSLLIGWASQNLQSNVSLNMGGSQYSSGAAATAKETLVNTYSWTITDGGQV